MKRSPLPKEVSDRSTREFTWSFATGRLAEPELLEWAVALRGSEVIQRKTLRDLFEAQGSALPDFVASAWQWIIRSWDSPDAQDRYERLLFRKRAKKGHLVLRDVEVFVNGTRPVIEAKSRNILAEMYGSGREKNPKSMHDLVHFSITSSDADVSEAIGLLNDLDDPSLVQITLSLIAALVGMLFAAREMGLVGPDGDISLWQVRRAYFVPPDQYPDGGGEPDRHSRGFAPSVKLIHHALIELAERQPDFVRGTVLTLKAQDFALCQRLWAALARHEKLASGTDVAAFLSSLGHREFWSNSYPEYAELRAVRWDAMPSASRVVLEKRLRRGPPASLFPKRLTLDERKQAQLNSAVTELLRIKSANGELSSRTMTWLSETEGHQGIRLQKATDGFNQGSIVTWGRGSSANKFVPPRPERLLPALQKAIGTDIWSDEGQSAADYVASHASEILALLSANDSHPGRYAKVLNLLGHRFRPSDKTLSVEERELARSMVQLVASLSDETMQIAADGLSEWFSSWSKHLTINELPLSMWLRLWKAAVQSTNSSVNTDEVEMRSLNSPAGKMVSAFLDLCPTIDGTFDPFLGTELGRMRDALLLASGAAIEDVRFRLLSNLTYFFLASPAWTLHELVEPLSASSSVADWLAFSQAQTVPADQVMQLLAEAIETAVTTQAFSDETRASIMRIAVLHMVQQKVRGNAAAFSEGALQQMLRLGGDSTRISTVRALADVGDGEPDDKRNQIFESVVRPLFISVWPKELTLVSKKLSKALVRLPSSYPGRYAEAVALVIPYVSSFDCWSVWDFGLNENIEDETRKLGKLASEGDAMSFLALLDKSVSGEDDAVVPHDIEQALQAITAKAKKAEKDVRFQRLLTLARR